MPAVLTKGSDGRPRCWWGASTPAPSAKQRAVPAAHDDLLERYHDEEWGIPVLDERGLFEKLALETFESGLSWRTILAKRDAFRAAFDGFHPDAVASFGDADVERLVADPGIVRHRGKIEAAIQNARAAAEMHAAGESLAALVWSHAPTGRRRAPRSADDLPAITPESTALSKELKRRGFRFVGPTTAYAAMQACGVVNDHLAGCWVRARVETARRS